MPLTRHRLEKGDRGFSFADLEEEEQRSYRYGLAEDRREFEREKQEAQRRKKVLTPSLVDTQRPS